MTSPDRNTAETIDPGMQRIRWRMTIGFANADRDGYFDIEIDATDDQIQKAGREEAFGFLEISVWKDEPK